MSERIDFGPVELVLDGPAAWVTFRRPEKKNAMSPEIHDRMHDVIDRIEEADRAAEEGIKVVVLSGEGDAFSAGMDLEKCFLEPFGDPDAYLRSTDPASRWFVRWKNLEIPTLAKVNGWCFGGAMLVVGITDMAIAADEAVFGLSEINFGIPPGGGTMWSVARNMNRKDALYYSYTAETFSGEDAVRMGFVNRSVPRAELDAEVERVVASITKKSRKVLAYTKRFYEHSAKLDFKDAQSVELALHHELIYYSRAAWVEKALPQFQRREFKPGLEAFSDEHASS